MVSTRWIVWSEVAAGDRPTVPMILGVSTQKMVDLSKMHTSKIHNRVFSQTRNIGNDTNIGIRGFTTRKILMAKYYLLSVLNQDF